MQRITHDESDRKDSERTNVENRINGHSLPSMEDLQLQQHQLQQRVGETTKTSKHVIQSRTVEIKNRQGCFHASARLDESGEYDDVMKEWTVHFLEKNCETSPSSSSMRCSVENLNGLEIRVGNHFGVNLSSDARNVSVRIHNIETEGEKSVIFIFGHELMILGRIIGYPEERSPNSDEDAVYEGYLPDLLNFFDSEEMDGSFISFGCVIFKDVLLKDLRRISEEEEKCNWECFE